MKRLWWGLWAGFKFTNLGIKRLFILGLIVLPIVGFFGMHLENEYNSIGDCLIGAAMSLAAYLAIIRVIRWVYDGFRLQRELANQIPSRATDEPRVVVTETPYSVVSSKMRFYHYPSSGRTVQSWMFALIGGCLTLGGTLFLFSLGNMGNAIGWAAGIAVCCFIGAVLLDVVRYISSPLSKSRYLSSVSYVLFWIFCIFLWLIWWGTRREETIYNVSIPYQKSHWNLYSSVVATGIAISMWVVRKTGYRTKRRRRQLVNRIISAGGVAGFFIVFGILPMRDYERSRMKSTEPVRTFSEDIRSRSSAPQSSAVDLVRNAAENQQEIIKVTVGEQLIVLPPPAGVFRYDGKSAKVDRFGQELLGPRSRLLAAFGSEGNLADVEKDKFPNLERRFMACVDRKCEDETVTLQSFASLKEAMRNKEDKSAKLNKDILGEIEKRSTKALTEMLHNSVFFKYTKFVPLGCFDESPESLLMTVLEKTKMPATDANSSPVEMIEITSAAWVLVRQHLVQLFCGSQLKSVEDVEWTRTQLKTWRDAVVAANSSTR